MNYEEIKSKILEIENEIFSRIEKEATELKKEYLEALNDNFEEEADGHEDFASYVEAEADSYVDFAFGAWLDKLLENIIGVTEADLKALTTADREALTQPYVDKFKEISQLGLVSEDI
jgi:4-alpha-glucanotransferase